MPLRLIALLLLTTLPAQATTPIAEVVCAPRERMVQRLTVQHRAPMSATGLRDADAVIEVWADAKGRWSLVQSYANGLACILAMGTDWYAGLTPPARVRSASGSRGGSGGPSSRSC